MTATVEPLVDPSRGTLGSHRKQLNWACKGFLDEFGAARTGPAVAYYSAGTLAYLSLDLAHRR